MAEQSTINFLTQIILTGIGSGAGTLGGYQLLKWRVGQAEKATEAVKAEVAADLRDLKTSEEKKFENIDNFLREHCRESVMKSDCSACQNLQTERRANCKDAIARMEKGNNGMQEHIEQLTKCINQLKPECL